MDRDEFIERCLQLASEVDWSQYDAENEAHRKRFLKLSPVQQAQELISNGDQFTKFDEAWQRGAPYDLAFAVCDLISKLRLGVSNDDSRSQIAFEANDKFYEVLDGLKPPLTVNDLAWGFREEHPDYKSSSIFIYLDDAMIDIKRFGGGKEPASYLPEPFFSYLRMYLAFYDFRSGVSVVSPYTHTKEPQCGLFLLVAKNFLDRPLK